MASSSRPVDLPGWVYLPAAAGALFVVLPLAAMVSRVDWGDFVGLVTSESSLAALRLSLRTSLASTVICVVVGVPMAMVLARTSFRGQDLLRSLVLLPLVLPPVVGGIALLYTFGRRGLLGESLEVLGLQIAFSTTAVVMAQTFVALPFLVVSLEGALRTAGQQYEVVAASLGAGPTTVFRRVTLPLVLPGPGLGRRTLLRACARRVRGHHHLRRQPPGRHPDPAPRDLPAARDRRRRRRRALVGPRGRRRRRHRRRPSRTEQPVSLSFAAHVPERGVEVTLDVADGETVALLGPNGAGKSTVLAAIAGLLRPDRCRVVLDGRPLSVHGNGSGASVWVPPHDRQVALLAQDPLLFPHLSALDNVAFGPRSRGARRAASRETGRRWLAEVGVEEYADRRPAQLSGGQAQRVAVARALAADPRLLLLDEPMAALDVAVAPAVRQTLRRVLKDRSAVIVTHDVLDALLLADRVVVLDGGRVVEEGPSSVVLAEPRSAFAARIAGLNLIEGTWHDGRLVTDGGIRIAGTAADPLAGGGGARGRGVPPAAVSVFRSPPGGSPRNALEVTVTHLEPLGDRVRVHAAELSADITPQAAADLDLAPGAPVLFIIKATEVAVYPS